MLFIIGTTKTAMLNNIKLRISINPVKQTKENKNQYDNLIFLTWFLNGKKTGNTLIFIFKF